MIVVTTKIFLGVDAKSKSHFNAIRKVSHAKALRLFAGPQNAQNFILTRRQILIIAVASAILASLISLEFLNMKNGESHSVARSSVSSSGELSIGMPLP